MKRSTISEYPNNHKKKKINVLVEQEQPISDVLLDENLVYEIMKHVDAKTLGSASCVNKQWHRTSQDERIWEMICTQHWTNNMSCGNNQLRSVVLALGGFRRLYAHYLWPLSRPSNVSAAASRSASTVAAAAGSSSVWPCLPSQCTNNVPRPTSVVTRWGKDEVQLSLSLLSIRYFEKMSYLPSKK